MVCTYCPFVFRVAPADLFSRTKRNSYHPPITLTTVPQPSIHLPSIAPRYPQPSLQPAFLPTPAQPTSPVNQRYSKACP